MQRFYDWFRWLYDTTGINLNYIWSRSICNGNTHLTLITRLIQIPPS